MFRTTIATLCLACGLMFGCSSTQNTDVAPGAVGANAECCGAESCCDKDKANMGAVADGECSKSCDSAAKTCPATGASMGAVSEGDCSKKCPSTCTKDASMGAVSEKDCSKKCPSTCTKDADASMGAVSGKSGCSKPCGSEG